LIKTIITFALFSFLLVVSHVGNVAFAADGPCQWRGKAPFCNGDCQPGERVAKRNQQGMKGSKKCATGNKVYCCVEKACTWRGMGPICNAKCLKGEFVAAEDKEGDGGLACTTGKKKFCCAE